MKRIIIFLFLLLLLSLASCKKEKKVSIDEIYGKYYYDECVYLSSFAAGSTIEEENRNHKNITRYVLMSDNYYYYVDSSTDATLSMRNVVYEEKGMFDNIISNEKIKSILKNKTTRFDIIRNNVNQGYSFVFTEDEAYYLELRYISSEISYDVWQIVKLKKIDGE